MTAVHDEQFGFSSLDDLINSIATFMTDSGHFVLDNVGSLPITSEPIVLRATSAIDVTGVTTDNTDDLNWGISFNKVSPGSTDAGSENASGQQLVISWGRMLGGGAANTNNSEISVGGARRNGNEAVMTAPTSPEDPGRDTKAVSTTSLHGWACTLTGGATARGFVLAVFSQVDISDWRDYGLLVIQRPVDCTGAVSSTGKLPLFAVWNSLDPATGTHRVVGSGGSGDGDQRWFKSVIWETDVYNSIGSETPESVNTTPVALASDTNPSVDPDINQIHFENTETLYGWPTSWTQPITQDNNEIPLVFPFGLTTSRFSYLEEMDLVCVGPACVFTFGQEIDLTVFSQARKYKVHSPSSDCSGVVVGILSQEP